jgi:hypothetical protein
MEIHPDIIAGLNGATMRKLIFSLFFLALSTTIVSAQQYDLVLEGGRVMDPETGVDAVRNVGIRDGKMIRISPEALSGRHVVLFCSDGVGQELCELIANPPKPANGHYGHS